MHQNDIELKKTAQHAGIALLVFLLLFFVAFAAFEQVAIPIISAILGETLGNLISEISSGFIYAAIFIIPALLFKYLNRSQSTDNITCVAPRFSLKLAPFIIMATVAISISCAYVNSWLGIAFGITNNLETTTEPLSILGFVLLVFTNAIVPAVCEEFFFRKTLMPAFLPYGEGFAIISTSILFGLMHQNILQIFYTTMAGILLGYAYAKTRSYLCVFLIHFVNNFVSVLQTAFVANLNEPYATIAVVSLTAAVLLLGAVSAIVLIFKEKTKQDVYQTGSFGQILPHSENFASKSTLSAPSKILFLSPSVLIFTIIAASTCLLQFFL